VVTRPVGSRPGGARLAGTRLGCLLSMALVGAGIYYGTSIAQMYMRYYQYQDAFKQEARFAGHHTDGEIRRHLKDLADSLQLPDDAQTIYVKRKEHHIMIWNEYYYHVELPFLSRDFYFNPQADGDL
jgi:hypothetical protein